MRKIEIELEEIKAEAEDGDFIECNSCETPAKVGETWYIANLNLCILHFCKDCVEKYEAN